MAMKRARMTRVVRAAPGWPMVAALLAAIGCGGDQYADVGTIDVSASKRAGEKAGLEQGGPRRSRPGGAVAVPTSLADPAVRPSPAAAPDRPRPGGRKAAPPPVERLGAGTR